MSFNFLGHPTADEISDLKTYLNIKYETIDLQIDATQTEIDNLNNLLKKLVNAEGALASQYGKNQSDFSLANIQRAPIINEDLSYFETHKFDSTQTAGVIDVLMSPWLDPIKRERETLDYKIRKIKYLVEQKTLYLQQLNLIKEDLRDDT